MGQLEAAVALARQQQKQNEADLQKLTTISIEENN